MAGSVSWGIEVGSGALKAVKLERTGSGISVADFAIIPHKRVLSTPDTDPKDAIRVAMGGLVSQFDLTKANISISVPGQSAFARFAKLPPVEAKQVPDIVKFEAVQQIPFPIDDVEWDYQTFADPTSPELEVGIFAIQRERVMDRLAQWQDVNVTPDVLTLSPLAAYNALAYDLAFNEKTPGTVILDIGTTSTDLIVAEPGRVWVRTFPIGGHQFTEALVTSFNLSYVKAEKLKREAENSQHARHMFQAMRPVFGDLAQDVQRSIGYYQSLHKEAKLTRLIGLGSTFHLPGLRKYLSQQLQMEVVRLENFTRVKADGARNEEFQANAMTLATAYGLALQGLDEQTIGVNLMPQSVMREALWAKKTRWFAAAAVVALLAGGAAFIRPVMDRAAVASVPRPAVIDQSKNEAKKLKGEWAAIESSYKPDFRAAGARLLLERREIHAHLVDDLGQMLDTARQKAGEAHKDFPAMTGLVFQKYETEYVPGSDAAANADPNAVPGATPQGGGFPGLPGQSTGPTHMHVTLGVATARKDSNDFIKATIQKWLFDNADRGAKVPYTIDTKAVKWEISKREMMATVTPEPGAAPALAGGPTPVRPGARPGGGQVDPNTGEPIIEPKFRQIGGPGSGPPRPFGSGPPGQLGNPGGGGTSAPPPGNEEVNKIAPLSPAPALAEPGTEVVFYTITFNAILRKPEADKVDGQGGGK